MVMSSEATYDILSTPGRNLYISGSVDARYHTIGQGY